MFIFYIITFLVIYNIVPAICTIRYSLNDGDLLTRNILILNHVDTNVTSWQWSVNSPGCSFDSGDTTQSVELICGTQGLHTVNLDYIKGGSNERITKYLAVNQDPNCYQWYFLSQPSFAINEFENLNGTILDNVNHVCIWIIDPTYASEEEKNQSALIPSMHSKHLTDQFKLLGQRPQLMANVHEFYPPLIFQYIDYIQPASCWLFMNENKTDEELHLMIHGENMQLYNCAVRDTFVSFAWSSIGAELQAYDALTSMNFAMENQIIQHPCYNDMAVLVTSTQLLWTVDGFHQTTIMPLSITDSAGVHVSSITVSGIALTFYNIIMLAGGVLYAVDMKNASSLVLQESTSITSIVGRDWCCSKFSGKELNNMFMGWSEDTLQIYTVVQDGNFKSVTPNLPTSGYSEFKILAVAFSPMYDQVGVLAKVTSGSTQVALYLYSMPKETWQLVTLLPYNAGQPYRMQFMWTGFNKLLMWSQSDVHFCSYNGITGTPLVQTVSISPAVVKYITQNSEGDIVLVSTTGGVFYTTSHWDHLSQLSMTSSDDLSAFPWFDSNRNLYMLSPGSSTVHRDHYPLKNEIVNSAYPDIHCPFLLLETNNDYDFYHLDIGNRMTLWASITYPISYYNSSTSMLQVEVDGDESLASVSVNIQHILFSQYVYENMTITIENNNAVDTYQWADNVNGEIGLDISPSDVLPVCQERAHSVSFVNVGCLSSMHIQMEGMKRTGCDKFVNYMYTVPASETEGDDLELLYDVDRLGCPVVVDRDHSYLPPLLLCTDSGCNEVMTANFVMWEENNRTFLYNTTMAAAGCLQKAQTWSEMMQLADTKNKSGIWGPENYRDCFAVIENGNKKFTLESYEIFNMSADMGINLPTDATGIYVMHIEVIDPHYSFCSLKMMFAMTVLERELNDNSLVLAISVSSIFSVIVLLFLFNYHYFSVKYYNRDSSSMEDLTEGKKENINMETL